MQEFNFEQQSAKIKICGKVYEFDPTCSECADALIAASKKVSNIKIDAAQGAVVMMLSRELRNVVGVILGKDAQNEIFKDRKPNILQELKLLNAIADARAESGVDQEIDKLLSGFNVTTLDE